jgi:tRNA-2-methylthio-N6-dimethylallyladenosine synthase
MSSDFIVGFPGETEDDFNKMMKLIDDIGYDNSFSFIYSPRPGTPAANLHDDTPHEVKLKRLQHLQKVIDDSTDAISNDLVGSTVRILVEGPSRRSSAEVPELMGRTECNRVVNFPASQQAMRMVGQMMDIEVTERLGYSLRGKLVMANDAVSV